MSNFEKVKLGDVCEVVSGTTPSTRNAELWNGDVKWITPAEIHDDSYYIYDTERYVSKKAGLRMLPKGTVLLSSRAPIGKVAIAGDEMCCNQGFKNLICTNRIHNRYLYHFLEGKSQYLNSLGRGATFKEVSKSIVENIEVPLPILALQCRIADVLDEVSNLITQHYAQVEKLNLLVKSRFVEMFGEAKSNPHGWQIVEIGSLARSKISNGFFAKSSDYSPSGNAFVLGVRDIVNRMYSNCSNLPKAKASESDFAKYSVAYGDVLFCRSSLVAEGIGKASIIPREVPDNTLFECHVIRLQLDLEKCSPEFIQVQTTTEEFRQQVKSKAKTSTMTTISQSGIASSSVMLPPLKAQNRFKRFVEQINKSKFASRQCLLKTRKLSNLDSDVFA